MAVNPFDPPHFGADLFDIYNDNNPPVVSAGAAAGAPQLPGGACNYVDLTPGANGSRCGCRRFWSRQSAGSPLVDQPGWCMCNHHACYHDEGTRDVLLQPAEPAPPATLPTAGQENERPRTGREPLSPVTDLSLKDPLALPGPDFLSFDGASQLSFLQKSFDGGFNTTNPPEPAVSSQPGTSMPDTLAWTDLIQSQPDAAAAATPTTFPHIPPQCLMSQTASTTSSIQAKYLRPFAGKGLQTLTGPAGANRQTSSQQLSKLRNDLMEPPSQKTSDVQESYVFVTADEGSTPRPGTATTQIEPRVAASEAIPRRALKNLTDTVGAHAQRLDRLETVSFSGAAHEECHDKHDHMDLRVTELESKVEDIEKRVQLDDAASRRGDRQDDDATPSVVSVGSSATGRPTYSQEVYSQLQSLQAQVSLLQSAIPSWSHSWEVEVVFLPFPLKRLWQYIHQFKADPASENGDEWTQLPMTHSSATLRSQSPFMEEWPTPDHDVEWLMPRACSDKSMTDKRLRSRGLIKKISVKGPDARSVHFAMLSAFGETFRSLQMQARPQSANPRASKFMGLHSSWVPLRKIHKDSRLRFLSPEEMLTPALWNVQFLNSVMMRSSEPRLFVTHPDAYLQDLHAYEAGWTWQKLREAARVYPSVSESQEIPEADAREEYWAWNEQLDDAPGAHNLSGSHRHERLRVSISPSVEYFPFVQSWRSASPVVGRGQSPMVRSRKGSMPPQTRYASVPISAIAHTTPASANPKRRVASYGQSRRSSPSVHVASQAGIMKRRRTRSPSHPRFTPRWTKSPSPMLMGYQDRQPARGTTPFAYATPYSNAPLQEVRVVRGSSIFRNEPAYPSAGEEDGDGDFDIQIYESASDESFGDVEDDDHENDNDHDGTQADDDDDHDDDMASIASAQVVMTHVPPADVQHDSQSAPQLPEDEPWPGIEDRDRHQRSDGENIDPHQMMMDVEESDASSQPSEYPSTQRAWPVETEKKNAEFHIHEDDE